MKLSITGSDTYTLTGQVIDKLIRAGNGDAALLYLYILRTKGQSTDKEAEQALGKTKGWIADATALLSRMGMLDIDADTHETAQHRNAAELSSPGSRSEPVQREYTQEEVVAQAKSGKEFTIIVDETTRRLGKTLTADDMLRLYGIYDNLRLPPEVILQLITHCISECSKTGDRHMPSMKYIEKAAYTWEREGVFTIERAEEYLKSIEAHKSARGKIKKVLQIRDRELTATEKRYVDRWIKMGFGPDTIAIAYDKTVVNTGSLRYPYMDTILESWDKRGLHTAAEVQNKDGRGRTGSQKAAGLHSHGNVQKRSEPSREEMERMRRLREKMDGSK